MLLSALAPYAEQRDPKYRMQNSQEKSACQLKCARVELRIMQGGWNKRVPVLTCVFDVMFHLYPLTSKNRVVFEAALFFNCLSVPWP